MKFSLQVFAGYRMQANNRSVHWPYTPHISRVMTYSSQTTTCKYLHKIASWGPCSEFSSEDIYVLAYLKGNCNGNILVHYLHSINGERSACAADIRSWGVEFNITSDKNVFQMKTSACRDGTLKNQPNKMGMTPQHIYTIPTSCAILPTMLFVC